MNYHLFLKLKLIRASYQPSDFDCSKYEYVFPIFNENLYK